MRLEEDKEEEEEEEEVEDEEDTEVVEEGEMRGKALLSLCLRGVKRIAGATSHLK